MVEKWEKRENGGHYVVLYVLKGNSLPTAAPPALPSAQPDGGAQQKTTLKFLAESQDTTAVWGGWSCIRMPLGGQTPGWSGSERSGEMPVVTPTVEHW